MKRPDEREAFKEWFATERAGLTETHDEWLAWKAACAWQREQDATLCEEYCIGEAPWHHYSCSNMIRKQSTTPEKP